MDTNYDMKNIKAIDIEVCGQTVIHPDVIQQVKSKMPDHEAVKNLAELFKILGDPTRTRILYALYDSEMCVCDLAALFSMSQSSISHQLRVLKQAKLVKYRKEGKMVFYSLADNHVITIFEQAFQHVNEG